MNKSALAFRKSLETSPVSSSPRSCNSSFLQELALADLSSILDIRYFERSKISYFKTKR